LSRLRLRQRLAARTDRRSRREREVLHRAGRSRRRCHWPIRVPRVPDV